MIWMEEIIKARALDTNTKAVEGEKPMVVDDLGSTNPLSNLYQVTTVYLIMLPYNNIIHT